jgi:hypothetical protein
MKCKKCWRECGPAKFVAEFGIMITPAYCDERHGGLNHTLADLRKQTEDENASAGRMNTGGGLSLFKGELTPDVAAERAKTAAEKKQRREAKRLEAKRSRGPKKQKKGGGEKKGKKGKPEKNARKNAKYGVAPQAQTPNPPTSQAADPNG